MKPDANALNAYVDGELDRDDAAAIARAVAGDPVLARKVAALSNLRSTLAESVEIPDLDINDLVSVENTNVADGKNNFINKKFALAACLAGLLVAGSYLYRDLTTQIVSDDWTTPVLAANNLWSLDNPTAETASVHTVGAVSGELAKLVYVPDLTSAKLQMVYVNSHHVTDGAALYVAGYAGTRGCKITLVAQTATGQLDGVMRDISTQELHAFAWNAGPLDYVLMSQGMESKRFELIATTVRQSSIDHQPVSSETRIALGISRETSAPCLT